MDEKIGEKIAQWTWTSKAIVEFQVNITNDRWFLCCAIALLPTNEATTRKTDLSKSSTEKTSTVKPTISQTPTANTTTSQPPTANPTTSQPTKANPTTSRPTKANPTTSQPTKANPTTSQPTKANPTTSQPTKANPTTSQPTKANPTTSQPTKANPTTSQPTKANPTTSQPTKANPTTSQPTKANPTTSQPTKANPTTSQPTKANPTTSQPTKANPANPTTSQPTKANPTTSQPTKANPTTSQPQTAKLLKPNKTKTTTVKPLTPQPPTAKPTTPRPLTAKPSTPKTTTARPSNPQPSVVPAKRNLFLEFKCAANGFITDISGVDKGEVVLLNGSNYCHLNEANCDWKNKTKLNVLHVKGENSSNIAGGKNAHFYQLECKSAGAFVASANTSMQIKIPAPTDFKQEIKKPTEPTKTIKLVITDKKGTPATSVHIGDPLLLKITGPADYTIEPISCNASSSVDTDYVMWTNDSCSSKDTAVIDNAWIHNKTIPNIVSISMYGFRFVKSNTVVVTCSALFCPKGMTCSSKPCVNVRPAVSSRRKRNADVESENGYLEESVSTSFTVVDKRIDTSGCSGTFGSVFTYVTACVLMLALK
ncbi:uncharacterized protein LOC134727628 [Mytilus trossulus]|uniref:uncharacterized protein LOC134727628 n=1 Tax=Mytilus trossulus TaxID=6551 RepID=UPI003004421B